MSTETAQAIDALKREVIATTTRAVANASTGMDQGDAAAVARDVIKEVVPVVVNQANAEPWYQSRVTWGVIIAGAATIAKPFLGDLHLSTEQAADIANALATAGQAIGFGLTLYGRWVAKKPLGA